MEYPIRKNIVSILRKALAALKKQDSAALDELSNHSIHDASIFQDKEAISIAVIIYSISKIMHRSESNPEYWQKVYKHLESDLETARFFLERDKDEKYNLVMKDILQNIGEVDEKLKLYIDDVLDKARVVKGSKLYEHGVSIERAAEMLGVSQWELMSYVGKTQIIDQYAEEVIPVSVRIEHAKRVFGL